MNTPKQTPLPFFARNTSDRPFVIKTGVVSGLTHHEKRAKLDS